MCTDSQEVGALSGQEAKAWIEEPVRRIPVSYVYEVVVAGGGPSGVCAAIAAARNGARTLLVERYGFCGGNAAIFLPLLAFLDQQGHQVIQGIGKEILDRVMELGGCLGHGRDPLHISYAPVDPEVLKRVVCEKLVEAGVTVLLHTMVVGAQRNHGLITHILLENKSGRSAACGRWFVDATGDGDLAHFAGVACEKGNEQGRMQPATLMFRMGGVDINAFRLAVAQNPRRFGADLIPSEHYVNTRNFIMVGMREVLEEAKAAGDVSINNKRVIFITQPRENEVAVNTTRVFTDATNADDLSRAEMDARRDVWQVERFLRTYIPGFEHAYVMDTAPYLGIRETRRIVGEYVLNRDDILSCRRFPDGIALASYPIDLHDPQGADCTLEHPPGVYGIPFGCLIPQGIANLLVVGRCISTTHEALAAIRVMPTGMALGQAGGTAVAMAAEDRLVDVRQIDSQRLRQRLMDQGANV